MSNNVQILNFNHNVVEVAGDNKLVITDNTKNNSITIPQPVTNILQINSPGPQGPAGTGGNINTGSFATTGSNNFIGNQNILGNVTVTGSFTVSGSNTFTNIGPTIFSGSSTSIGGFTGSLQGTASWASNFVSASNYVPNSQTSSFVTNSQTSSFVQNSQTSSFVTNNQTSSMLAPYILNSQTSSFVQNSQTSSFVTNNQTSSFVQNSQTSSMTVATASYVSGAVHNSSNPALSSSYATTASYANNGSETLQEIIYNSRIPDENMPGFSNIIGTIGSYDFFTIKNTEIDTGLYIYGSDMSGAPGYRSAWLGMYGSINYPPSPAIGINSENLIAMRGTPFVTSTNFILAYGGDSQQGGISYISASNITFPYIGNAVITGSLLVSGSSGEFGGITGSLQGTASYATTASYAINGLSGGTDGYIPLWSGSMALTSSYLYQSESILKTIYNGTDNAGILLNLSQSQYQFGSWNTGNYTNIVIGDKDKQISIDAIDLIVIGDNSTNQHGTQLIINDTSQSIKTTTGTGDKGLNLNFANNTYKFGDYNNLISGSSITIDDIAKTVSITGSLNLSGSFNDGIPKLILTGVTDTAGTLTYNTVVNTLKDTFTFTATNGVYELVMNTSTPFTSGYTYVVFSVGLPGPGGGNVYNYNYEWVSTSKINFYVKKNDDGYGGILINATIEIRVYPTPP